MRRARINYTGCYYHVMSRGYEGKKIFNKVCDKEYLLKIVSLYKYRNHITIYGWCIMDNHYHLVIKNEGNYLSKFMKELNSSYGNYYRRKYGGRGVVFDGRFKSSIIENDEYLLSSLLYLYKNPVRAGIVKKSEDYLWSSLREYLFLSKKPITDILFLNKFIGEKEELYNLLEESSDEKITPFSNNWGETLGSNRFRFHSLKKYNRRKTNSSNDKKHRAKDRFTKKPGEIIEEFLKENLVSKSELMEHSWKSARLRGKLLLILRDKYSLKLCEIHKLSIFNKYSISSMGRLYKNAKKNNS